MHGDEAEAHREAFEAWCAADPRHGAIYAELEGQWDDAGLLAEIRDRLAPPLPDPSAPIVTRTRFVAATVVVLGLAVTLMFSQPAWLGGEDQRPPAQIAAQLGEIRSVKLADGSRVTLDTESAVRLAFTSNERRLFLLRGRARFEVAHRRDRPFVVVAGSGSVVARGTVFDVSVIEGRVHVALLRGSVDVRREAEPNGAPPGQAVVHLSPGETTAFSSRRPLAPPEPATQNEFDWPSGMMSFDDVRLGEAIAEANRYSATKIRVADPAIEHLEVTGAYRAGDTQGLARSLAASFDLHIATDARGDMVLERSAR
jgi:transmembrane sensor